MGPGARSTALEFSEGMDLDSLVSLVWMVGAWMRTNPYTTVAVMTMGVCGYLLFKQRARRVENVVFPFPWYPFVGNMMHVMSHFDRWSETVNKTTLEMGTQPWGFGMCLAGPPVVFMPPSKEIAQHVLHTAFDKYTKGEYLKECLAPLLGNGIFNSDGDVWFHQRKTALAMFSRNQVRGFHVSVFAERAKEFVAWAGEMAETGEVVDLQAAHFAFTMDTFVEVAFGVQIHTLTGSSPSFGAAFDAVQSGLNRRFFDPLWRVKRLLGLGQEGEVSANLPKVDRFARDVIDSRLREMEAEERGEKGREDILSLFIAASLRSGEPISEQELRDVAMNFILAGRDTTACALSWTVWEVCRHPEVLERIREESERVAPQASGGVLGLADDPEVLYRTLKSGFPYLEAVISESLRLHPSVPIDSKLCVESDVWPDGTVIPAGTTVGYSPYAFGRSPLLWGPTAGEFDPSRFLEDDGVTLKPRSAYKFLTFNAGKRLCLGMETAYLETKMLLSAVLTRFEVEVGVDDAVPVTTILLPIKGGLPVRMRYRPPGA